MNSFRNEFYLLQILENANKEFFGKEFAVQFSPPWSATIFPIFILFYYHVTLAPPLPEEAKLFSHLESPSS